jgi:hypothetical protein
VRWWLRFPKSPFPICNIVTDVHEREQMLPYSFVILSHVKEEKLGMSPIINKKLDPISTPAYLFFNYSFYLCKRF